MSARGTIAWYEDLFKTQVFKPGKEKSIESVGKLILKGMEVYRSLEAKTGVPAALIGCIHNMEGSCDMKTYLGNGERVIGTSKKTVLVPKGRGPFATFEAGALDALAVDKLDKVKDWNVGLILQYSEKFNGMGYMKKGVNSPYIWSFSQHYTKGKYVRDGVYDADAVSEQVGVATVIKWLADHGHITLKFSDETTSTPVEPKEPIVMDVKIGDEGSEVKALQKQLVALGYEITVDGMFGKVTETAVKDFQSKHGRTADGVVGKFTKDAIAAALKAPVEPKVEEPKAPVSSADYFGAHWIGVNLPYLGLNEKSKKLNEVLVPEWAHEGLSEFKTLSGNEHAWCSVLVNDSFRKVGIKPTNSALAASWRKWGVECDYWFGSVLGIQHASGRGHVTFFLYWIDEKNKIAACYGGNQSDFLSIVPYNLSGNAHDHDQVINGARWPKGQPAGQKLSKEQVLAAYPNLKVGAKGSGSTQ